MDVLTTLTTLGSSRGPHFRQFRKTFPWPRSIIAVTAGDRRRRHSKIIELIQSRPPQNPLFFHSWACLSHSLVDPPSFSGVRTLVHTRSSSFPFPPPSSSPGRFFPRLLLHADLSLVSPVISSLFPADAMDSRQNLQLRDDKSGTDEFVELISNPFRNSVSLSPFKTDDRRQTKHLLTVCGKVHRQRHLGFTWHLDRRLPPPRSSLLPLPPSSLARLRAQS